jgi:GTP-binding protein HflX
MSEFEQTGSENGDVAESDDVVARVLASAGAASANRTSFGAASDQIERAQALQSDSNYDERRDGEQLDREDRQALRRVAGLSTELDDVTEVEYRQLRIERDVLNGIYTQGTTVDAENSMRELYALAETAGAVVLDGLLQRRAHPDPSTYFGKGKAEELRGIVAATGADTVIADTELAPSQRRALEDIVKVKVIDRTAVILDIFSQHAKSREGKAQVELAQLEYMLPRLRGWGEALSRQGGGAGGSGDGMGSRGPGETKIELDRRRIHTRMSRLRKQIKGFAPAREAKRANRNRFEVPSVAIVGYTNAGKSSLLNHITSAGVLVENALFATLDATVRKSVTADGRPYTLTDTVGFVRNLPHQLVEAFRSTLEEVGDSDVIVHVVDASHPDPASQLTTVREVIAEVEARDIPEIVVFNKVDLLQDDDQRLLLRALEPAAIFVSARSGEGVEELQARIAELVPSPDVPVELLVPYDRGDVVASLHDRGRILSTDYVEGGTRISAMVNKVDAGALKDFVVVAV